MKTEFVDVLSLVSKKLYDSATEVMRTASRMIPANTFCIANLTNITTTVVTAYNRESIMMNEGLVIDNEESYCALVKEKAQGPLIIDNNLTHPLTKDMDATQCVGGCSFLGVPILTTEGEIYGSLCAFDHNFYQYEDRDVELLLSLSDFFTTVLEMEEAVQQLQQAEERAKKVLDEKSNLIAVLSHEIRTPMNGVMGMAGLLQSTNLTPEQTSYLNVIETCGESLLSILNQILDYSRIEAGKMELEVIPFNLRLCVEQVLQLFAVPASDKGIRLSATYGNDIDGLFVGDCNKLRQILLNLVGNAIKFTNQGEVRVEVRSDSRHKTDDITRVIFSVVDTGIGIPDEGKERLFHSFSQLHMPLSDQRSGGVGLGLSICKQLAELLGGRIWLEKTDASGSIFAFELPFDRSEDGQQRLLSQAGAQ